MPSLDFNFKYHIKNINYTNYPLVLFTSFDKTDEVEGLPFALESESARMYLSNNKGVKNLFGFIGAKNTLKGENACIYYHLNDNLFYKIEYDVFFRQRNFSKFFVGSYIKAKYGVILLGEGGQYIYSLLGKEETKRLHKRNGRYIAAALFVENTFIGFEEGAITDSGVDVLPTGYYAGGMDKGGYLSFVMVTLGHAEDKNYQLLNTSIKEKIFQL